MPLAKYFTTPRSPAGNVSARAKPRISAVSADQRPMPLMAVSRSTTSSSGTPAHSAAVSGNPDFAANVSPSRTSVPALALLNRKARMSSTLRSAKRRGSGKA